MAKSIIYGSDANMKLLSGVEKLEKAVASTLGPCGKNVIIDEYGSIHSTKDGVTVAKSVILKDKYENLGANAIREVAAKSADVVGDGTTTSTVLAAAIYRNGIRHVSLGANAMQVKNGIKKAAAEAITAVKGMARAVSSKEDIRDVAIVSANGDEKIGDIISDIMSKIGEDGTIKVEDGQGVDVTSKVVEGMVIDKSYASPYMVTNPETMEATLDDPFILLVDDKLTNIQALAGCLRSVHQTGRPLFIIAESYSDDILGTLIMNRMRPDGLNSVVIQSPSYGVNRRNMLDDIAILTGGRVVSDVTGTKLENAVVESGILGSAKRVVVNRLNTVIIGGAGKADAVKARTDAIRAQANTETDEFDKKNLRERLAKLTSGIGVITVGAATDAERKELRDRVDDAFCASKAAVKSGIVAGGGCALLAACDVAKKAFETSPDGQNIKLVGDEIVGVRIFLDSLEVPARKILENAGIDPSLIIAKMREHGFENSYGYDVMSKEFKNMVDAGIIDPADVVINEIQNASSVASLLLTTEALIVDEPDENKHNVQAMPQMM